MAQNKGSFFPTKEEINSALHTFNYREMMVFLVFCIAFITGIFLILSRFNDQYLIEQPLTGGRLEEGVIGSPRFINPVLGASNTDRDLTTLVFSGLMKEDANGVMVPDLAERYEVSGDFLTYTFTIKEGAVFHDHTRVTADDVIFTINAIKDGALKSPYQANWDSVSALKIDERTVALRLASPYVSFLEYTSIGILPAHLWAGIDADDFTFSDMNVQAIGSGPYKIKNIEKKKNGLIESVTLTAFHEYVGGRPYIDRVVFSFYRNEEELVRAYRKNKVDQIHAISGKAAEELKEDGVSMSTAPLSRVFGLFFNANKQELFRNKTIVEAMNLAINKEEIVASVLHGYGSAIDGPLPAQLYIGADTVTQEPYETRLTAAATLLDKEGWKMGDDGYRTKDGKRLGFSISTGDALELQNTAEIIKNNLQKIGMSVEVKVFEIGNLNQSVIRPRDYEALFFGQIIANEADLFAFWHSSQRNDPGLNIASYTSSTVDGLLQKIISGGNAEEKQKYLGDLQKEIRSDMPALFMYTPDFIYVTDKHVKGITTNHLTFPSQRLTTISDWYIRTEKVWKFLARSSR